VNPPLPSPAVLSGVDVLVLILMFLGVTAAGHWLGGRHVKGSRGFFLGDRSMPWWAVSVSMIATKVSALTFVALPASVFVAGGDLTYVQLFLGFVLGNLLMALIFVRPYYETGVYSPYEYMGQRIDLRVAALARLLFFAGTILSQGVRLLATSLVLEVITGWPMLTCVGVIVAFSVLWSWMGGIKTVIWTDLILFLMFMAGGVLAAVWAFSGAELPLPEVLRVLDEKGKLVFLRLQLDPTLAFTLWTGLIGAAVFELGSNAIDQVVTQRVMTCRSSREARWACIGAAGGIVPSSLMLLVGLGLVAFYHSNPLPGELAELAAAGNDRVFPYFVGSEMPPGVAGMIIAALFASGISTLDSALTALSQTTVGGLLRGVMPGAGASDPEADRALLRRSRGFVLFWGLVLGAVAAALMNASQATGLIQLGLQVPGYVYGSLLGIALLARFGRGTWPGVLAGTLASVAAVLLLRHLGVAFFWWYPAATLVLCLVAGWSKSKSKSKSSPKSKSKSKSSPKSKSKSKSSLHGA
jgi:solute:Na+ symporter, SSS family